VSVVSLTAAGIGASDCEVLRDEALAQPVNAVSSLAYVVVGVAIVAVAIGRRRAVLPSVVYGACLAGVGIGSVLFHGPQPAGSRVLHDLPILVTVIFIVVRDLVVVRPGLPHPWAVFVLGSVAATAATIVEPDSGAALTGVGVGAIAVLETIVYRRRLRPVGTARQRRAYVTIIAVAALAAATWLLGRTGSPACDPDATFQFHGLWHLVSSLVFGLWWWLAEFATDAEDRSSTPKVGRVVSDTTRPT
jgi:hypothetical protein